MQSEWFLLGLTSSTDGRQKKSSKEENGWFLAPASPCLKVEQEQVNKVKRGRLL